MKFEKEKTTKGKMITTSAEFLRDLIERLENIDEHLLTEEKDNLKIAYLVGAITGLTKRLNRVCHEDIILIDHEINSLEDLIELACVEFNEMSKMINDMSQNEDLFSLLFTQLLKLKKKLNSNEDSKGISRPREISNETDKLKL